MWIDLEITATNKRLERYENGGSFNSPSSHVCAENRCNLENDLILIAATDVVSLLEQIKLSLGILYARVILTNVSFFLPILSHNDYQKQYAIC